LSSQGSGPQPPRHRRPWPEDDEKFKQRERTDATREMREEVAAALREAQEQWAEALERLADA
jgi:hypothetical protein